MNGIIKPGEIWLDSSGEVIQAHAGGILYHEGTYYWYGQYLEGVTTIKDNGLNRVDFAGVTCYSSQDLIHWHNCGIALPAVKDDPSHDLHPDNVVERPKVLYNRKTNRFVMWFHMNSPDYDWARTGVAVSVSPAGPFTYQGSFRPNGEESRDMTLFQDEDGKAYLIYSSEFNKTLHITELSEDYLSTQDSFSSHFSGLYREAPALFKSGGKYFMITSGCTGWDPSAADYAVADHIHGPWAAQGNPCVGPDADKTFMAQSTFVLPVQGKPGAFIFLADIWKKDNLSDSRYVWLPFRVEGTHITIAWQDSWKL